MPFNNIYRSKKVLITGHTGFKGSWLSSWLIKLGADVIGISKNVVSHPSNYEVASIGNIVQDLRVDVTNLHELKQVISNTKPDFIFHLAAQALVRNSYANPIDTFMTNTIGTINILESLKTIDKKVAVVMITSDKAYDNSEWVWGYRENDKIGGKDPYSASKGMAELAIRSYLYSFFSNKKSNIRIVSTRAGNVIGGGDWAEDRIVPDCVKAWSVNKTLEIRNPNATRPWQHVLEPLSGYLLLGEMLYKDNFLHGEAFNFGPNADQNYSVKSLIEEMQKNWPEANWLDTSDDSETHEAGLLKLNCDKALNLLSWKSILSFEETIKMTSEWYRLFYQEKNMPMLNFSISQIDKYVQKACDKKLAWAYD